MDYILSTAFEAQINVEAVDKIYKEAHTDREYFRFTHWNLERGYKLKDLDKALNHSTTYLSQNNSIDTPIDIDYFEADIKMMKESHRYYHNYHLSLSLLDCWFFKP